MKKLLLVVAAAVGASILKKNIEKSKADKELWSEATGSKPATATPASDGWSGATDKPAG